MPKPILSDSLFNADDVATAILNKANLQVANENLGVIDHTSSIYVLDSNWIFNITPNFFSFNGIMFVNFQCEKNHNNGAVVNGETIFQIIDNDYKPSSTHVMPSASYQGDVAYHIRANTSGEFSLIEPYNAGGSSFWVCCNGTYRYN